MLEAYLPNYHIWSIGCQMNTSDSRRLGEELDSIGYQQTGSADEADVVILYSCMVRQHAEDKVHSELGHLRKVKQERPGLRICLAGCIGEVDFWRRKYPFVDFFLEPGQDLTIQEKLEDLIELDELYRLRPEGATRLPHVSEGITIHQGCNRRCTFCIVPSTRGGERSRGPAEIRAEIERL